MTVVEIRTRDYAEDMRKLIDRYRSAKSYNAGIAAHEIVEQLLGSDRELLFGWLEGHAVSTIRAAITATDAASRSYARTGTASVFAEAALAAENGDNAPLRQGFLQAVYVVDRDNNRKAFKDMVADDVLFVAANYEDRARSAQFEAAFMKAVAKRIGKGRVADKFNNVQLAELRQQITGK